MKTRVDVLLRVRSIEKDQRAKELALAQAAAFEAQGRIDAALTEITQVRLDYDAAQSGGAEPQTLALYEAWFAARRREIIRLRGELDALEAEVETRRAALTAAAMELETYEKYRDQLLDAHNQDLKAAETRRLDEFALRGYRRHEA